MLLSVRLTASPATAPNQAPPAVPFMSPVHVVSSQPILPVAFSVAACAMLGLKRIAEQSTNMSKELMRDVRRFIGTDD